MAHRHPIRQYRPRKRKWCKRYTGWSRCSKEVSYEGFGRESRLRAKGRVKLELYFQEQSWQSSLWWGNGEGVLLIFTPKGLAFGLMSFRRNATSGTGSVLSSVFIVCCSLPPAQGQRRIQIAGPFTHSTHPLKKMY